MTEAPTTTAAPTTGDGGGSVRYSSCAQVRAAGKAPIHAGDPGYSRTLDRDGDGVACE
ncbi:excalibur calcium-binding domain-containing protein [Gordonia pseudamarae]|uniref:excalibur calcium-binding domain-containing protein n=1 Tax=Gordonia pseudamarae TaxID=2831662 RepID=UPI002AFE4F5F|nr:excalibur calcium-binding domain-containing protein [Gordonia pseudamarae]